MSPKPSATPRSIRAIGKRKTAIARVYLQEGSGKFTVNSKTLEQYFPFFTHHTHVLRPLKAAELTDRFDVNVNVQGGGTHTQSLAVQHGISRALVSYNPELRKTLKPLGLLRRDSRVKERKKYGQKGARKRFQYSKR